MAAPTYAGPTCWIEFAQLIKHLCVMFDGSVTGGGRTEKRNAHLPGGVTGHPNSRHRWKRAGAADDVVFDTPGGYAAASKAARKAGLKVVEYPHERRLHLAARGSWVPK